MRTITTGVREALMNRIQCMRDTNGLLADEIDSLAALRAACCGYASSSFSSSSSSSSDPEISALPCGTIVSIGDGGGDIEFIVDLEEGTGECIFLFPGGINRFTIVYGGETVIDTDTADELLDYGAGSASFMKTTSLPRYAYVTSHDSSTEGLYTFRLFCPINPEPPSSSSSGEETFFTLMENNDVEIDEDDSFTVTEDEP